MTGTTWKQRSARGVLVVVAGASLTTWLLLGAAFFDRTLLGHFSWKWWLREQVLLSSLGHLFLFAVVGAVPTIVYVVRPRWFTLRALVAVVTWLAALSTLLFFQRIAPIASLILASGVAVEAFRRSANGEDRLIRWSGRIALAGVVASIGASGAARAMIVAGDRQRVEATDAGAPNALIIILDTVRARSMGLFGGVKNTPNLERWAQRGIVFDRAISAASWTLPSHASIFTGQYASVAGADWKRPLPDSHTTLAEVLQERGYATGGFVANHVAAWYRTGLAQGFAHYDDTDFSLTEVALSTTLTQTESVVRAAIEWERTHWLQGAAQSLLPIDLAPSGNYVYHRTRRANEIVTAFQDWQRQQHRPFFAFVNLFDAHDPYLPPPEFYKRFGTEGIEYDRYLGAIAYEDGAIDRLLRGLERDGVLDNTLVIIASDHGESFGEHQIFGHGNALYRNQLHVPLLILPPRRASLPVGIRVESIVSLRDVAATTLDLLGIQDRRIGGTSLRAVASSVAGEHRSSPAISEVSRGINVARTTFSGHADQKSLTSVEGHVVVTSLGTVDWYAPHDVEDLTNLAADSVSRVRGARLLSVQLANNGLQWPESAPTHFVSSDSVHKAIREAKRKGHNR